MKIGARIKQLRMERNLSQEAVAEALQLSRQAVAKWESGRSMPSTANLMALCDVFGVTLEALTRPEAAESKEMHLKDGELRGRRARIVLAVCSAVLVLLSLAAAVFCHTLRLPEGVIGHADAPTGIYVTGTPLPLYGLHLLTILVLATTAFAFWKTRKRRGR